MAEAHARVRIVPPSQWTPFERRLVETVQAAQVRTLDSLATGAVVDALRRVADEFGLDFRWRLPDESRWHNFGAFLERTPERPARAVVRITWEPWNVLGDLRQLMRFVVPTKVTIFTMHTARGPVTNQAVVQGLQGSTELRPRDRFIALGWNETLKRFEALVVEVVE
jgi:hypothetical protein